MKHLLHTAAAFALLGTTLQADFTRIEMGVGGWNQEPSGYISYTESNTIGGKYTTNGLDDTSTYAWMLIKHPIPILPNIRLEYTNIDDKGSVKGTFEHFDTRGNFQDATLSMKEYDIIPYYNILDNTMWTTLDLGIDLKVIDSTFEAKGVTLRGNSIPNTTYTDSETIVVPMGYARVRVEIPATGFGLESDVKYITYDGSTVYDVRAKVDYTFDLSVIKPALELGYRVQKFDITSDDDKTKMDMDFSGVYAGLMLRF